MSTTTKRIKKVFRNMAEVAHIWAQQTQDEGRCSNGFFEGDTIYSYGKHFPIARIFTDDAGNKTVFFTTRTYSNTTAKHIGYTNNACSHMDTLYMNDIVTTDDIYSDYAYTWYHRNNIAVMITELEELLLKFKQARRTKQWHLRMARNCAIRIKNYTKFFKIKKSLTKKAFSLVDYAFSDDRDKEVDEAIERERIRLTDPELEKKRKKAQEARERRIEKENAEQLEKWRNFEAYTPYVTRKWSRIYGYGYTGRGHFDLLRYNVDQERVETSKGVKVPVEIAHTFYRYIKIMIAKGGCTSRNCCDYVLMGHYTVDKITEEEIVVGCHTIQMTEVEAIAKQLNWI